MLENQCNEMKPTSSNGAYYLGARQYNMYSVQVPGPQTSHVVPNNRDHYKSVVKTL